MLQRAVLRRDQHVSRLPGTSCCTEYRTRLIADVVTGKLDVRGAAAQLSDEADDQDPIGGERPTGRWPALGDLYGIDESVEDSVLEEEVTA